MNKMLKNTIKTSIAFFIIGAAIALAAAPTASLLEPLLQAFPDQQQAFSAAAGSVNVGKALWTGVYFGMFGALSAVVPPVVGKVLGLQEKQKTPQINIAQGKGISFQVEHEVDNDPNLDSAIPGTDPQSEHSFAARVRAEQAQVHTRNI